MTRAALIRSLGKGRNCIEGTQRKGKLSVTRSIQSIFRRTKTRSLNRKELQAKVGNIAGAYGMLDRAVSDYLLYNLNMTKEEINANKALFLTAQQTLPNLVEHLADLRERAARSGKGTGWIINGLKGKLKTK